MLRPTTGLHELNYTVHGTSNEQFINISDAEINEILTPFGLTFSDFCTGIKSHATKRKFEIEYTYENKLFIFVEGYGYNKNTVHVCCKGGAFDAGLVNLDNIFEYFSDGHCKVTDLAIYNDIAEGKLTFSHMWQSTLDFHRRSNFKSVTTWPGNKKDDPRTIYYGAKGDRLAIYERGILHAKDANFDYPLNYTRLEAQMSGKKAQEVFNKIAAGEDMQTIAAGLIAGYVTFTDPKDPDKNPSRRKTDQLWLDYLQGVERLKIEIPRPEPNTEKQIEAFRRYVKQRLIEHDPAKVVKAFLIELADRFQSDFSKIEAAILPQLQLTKI